MKYREMKRQPRAKAMLPAIKHLIVRRALENTDKERNLVAYELIEEIAAKYPKEITPTHATLIKRISEARSKYDTNPLDEPWSMAVLERLDGLDIPNLDAETIMAIMNVQHYINHEYRQDWQQRIRENMKKGHPDINPAEITDDLIAKVQEEYPILTIRQAKWVGRLYCLQTDTYRLYRTALMYSNYEIVSEISGTGLDTNILDHALSDWERFDELVVEYGEISSNDENSGEASRRSFKPKQEKEEG